MLIARVIGDVVTAQKPGSNRVRKSLLVQPLNLDSTNRGQAVLALNFAEAAVGDVVLLAKEGFRESPFDTAVIGVIDRVDLFPASRPENK